MEMLYSALTGTTYFRGRHESIPPDATAISEERYRSVIANPAPGKIRSHDPAGLPILIDPPVYVPTADDHRAAIAAERYKHEVAGILVGGVKIDTDDRSKLLINGSVVEAMLNPDYVLQWKTPEGFVPLTADQVIAIGRAVRAHVQACFDREAELLAALERGDYTEALLYTGWPQTGTL